MEREAAAVEDIVLQATGLKKSFGRVRALTDGSLKLRRGEIMALVGDNGAGKSTLIKCLSGVLTPDAGAIETGGKRYGRLTVPLARALGVAVVYQDLALADHLDVAANIWLGAEPLKWGFFLDRARMIADAEKLLARLSVRLTARGVPVGALSGGQRQAVAAVRAIAQGGRILIMDEPTAAMGLREASHLLEVMAQLRDQGLTLLCISHNLPQILQIADRVTVLRRGVTIREEPARGLDPLKLAGWMSGALS